MEKLVREGGRIPEIASSLLAVKLISQKEYVIHMKCAEKRRKTMRNRLKD